METFQNIQLEELSDKMTDQTHLYRVVLIGDSSVGKTSILNQLQTNSFDPNENTTIGAMFILHAEAVDPQTIVEMQIWDTAGQEKFKSLGPIYYRNSAAAICVFDLTRKDSWLHVDKWIEAFRSTAGGNSIIFIAGNKVDLDDSRQVSKEEIQHWVEEKKYNYYETSAATGQNIATIFHELATILYQKSPVSYPIPKSKQEKPPEEPKSMCC